MRKSLNTRIILFLFLLSGAAALIYQITWFKYISFFIGNSTYAQSVVLGTFMAGVAIGAYIYGKKSDDLKDALSIFGSLELVVGVYSLIFPVLIYFLSEFYLFTLQELTYSTDSLVAVGLKLIISVFSILLPAIFLGGTFPVLVKTFIEKKVETGSSVGTLYYINSLGALIGCALAGFYLLEKFGLLATLYFAAFLDLAIGLYVLIKIDSLKYRIILKSVALKASSFKGYISLSNFSNKNLNLALFVAFISGFSAFIIEICWVRIMAPILGSTVYSFTLMLIGFISGITLGSFIYTRYLSKYKHDLYLVMFVQLLIATSLFISIPFYSKLPFYLIKLIEIIPSGDNFFLLYILCQAAIVVGVMIVPTTLMGISLPAIIKFSVINSKGTGEVTGKVYSSNTWGAVFGSLLAGLLFIPLIGIKYAIDLSILLFILVGVVLFIKNNFFALKKTILLLLLVVVAGMYYFFSNPHWNVSIMVTDIPRLINNEKTRPKTYSDFLKKVTPDKILYYKEGVGATIAVVDKGGERILYTNGKGDSNTKSDMPTQVLLGQIPMFLHPAPDSVMLIGFGGGTTAGSVLTHDIKYIKVADISRETFEASIHFQDYNNKPLNDGRLEKIADDGLSVLKSTNKKFDVIISQPSNPYVAGVGSLFTKEFFEVCNEKLKPNGIIAQWFNLYEMNDDLLKIVIKTFSSVFENFSIFQTMSHNILIVGSNDKIDLDFDLLEEKFSNPAISDDLRRIKIQDFPSLLSTQMVRAETLGSYIPKNIAINTKNNMLLELKSPKVFFANEDVKRFFKYDNRISLDSKLYLSELAKKRKLTNEELLNIGTLHATPLRGSYDFGLAVLKRIIGRDSTNSKALTHIIHILESSNLQSEADFYRSMLMNVEGDSVDNPEVLNDRGVEKAKAGRIEEAIKDFSKAIQLDPNYKSATKNRALAYLKAKDYESANEDYTKLIQLDSTKADYHYSKAYALSSLDQHKKAMEGYLSTIKLAPKHSGAYYGLGHSYAYEGDTLKAIYYYDKAIEINPNFSVALYDRGVIKLKANIDGGCEDILKAKQLKEPRASSFYAENCY